MVAAEPFRNPEELDSSGLEAALEPSATAHLSVREIRSMLSSLERPDPHLYARLTRDPRATVRQMGYSAMRRGRSLAANEDIFRDAGVRFLAGADEAGRGALAGPLVAAAVMFAPQAVVKGVRDSKLLTPERREELYGEIIDRAESVSVVFIDANLIDRWGIQPVNMQALGEALSGIDRRCQCFICDHFRLIGCRVPAFGIPRADETFQSVAAASIVAKVERDRVMRSLHHRFPRYNFMENKGYATSEHISALAAFGPCEVHRRTFSSVLGDEEPELWERGVEG